MLYSTPNSGSSCVGTEIAIYNGLIRIAYCKTVSISFPYVTHDNAQHWSNMQATLALERQYLQSLTYYVHCVSLCHNLSTLRRFGRSLYSLLLWHNIFSILWRFHIFAMWQKPTLRKNHRTRLELECYGAWVRHASLLLQAPTYTMALWDFNYCHYSSPLQL